MMIIKTLEIKELRPVLDLPLSSFSNVFFASRINCMLEAVKTLIKVQWNQNRTISIDGLDPIGDA